jgi:phosphatidate cytidylyltransferase
MLKQRLLTAFVLALIALGVILWLPASATALVLLALVLLGAWEWSAFPRFTQAWLRYAYLGCVALLLVAAWLVTDQQRMDGAGLEILLLLAMAWWLVALAWVTLFPLRVSPWSAALAGIMVIVPAWTALARLVTNLDPTLADNARALIIFLLLLVAAADAGAYFAGKRFGRVKLAPRVSPGKTWEGLLGGLATAGIIAALGAFYFKPRLNVEEAGFLAVCAAVVVASVVGDLTESLFKRYAGLKDSGSAFPGHGGVMDRIDGVTAAAPIFVLGLIWLGLTP